MDEPLPPPCADILSCAATHGRGMNRKREAALEKTIQRVHNCRRMIYNNVDQARNVQYRFAIKHLRAD